MRTITSLEARGICFALLHTVTSPDQQNLFCNAGEGFFGYVAEYNTEEDEGGIFGTVCVRAEWHRAGDWQVEVSWPSNGGRSPEVTIKRAALFLRASEAARRLEDALAHCALGA